MKKTIIMGAAALLIGGSCFVCAGNGPGGAASETELKSYSKKILLERRKASILRGRINRIHGDDQKLCELQARKKVIEKAIDDRYKELNKDYAELADKIDKMEEQYFKMRKELVQSKK